MSGGNKFTPTANAISHVDKLVNLIGVAAASTDPTKTAGTDFFRSIKIIDESQPRGFYLHFFADAVENLPSVANGDKVLVSNFKILHIAQVKKDEGMLFIWDGTDIPPAPVDVNTEDDC